MFTPCLFQPVLLEIPRRAEEFVVGLAVLVRIVFDGGELHSAKVVGGLLDTVIAHRGLSLRHRAPGQREPDRLVQSPLHDVLAVVVVDLDLVEGLEALKAVEQQGRDVALHAGGKLLGVHELASAIGEGRVADRQAAYESRERDEEPFAGLDVEVLVILMAVQQRLGIVFARLKLNRLLCSI